MLMNYVNMFYFTTIIVALMRGVLIKYLMGSKIEEETTIIVQKTEIYIQNIFRDLENDHPIPWNLVMIAIECLRKVTKCLKKMWMKNFKGKKDNSNNGGWVDVNNWTEA